MPKQTHAPHPHLLAKVIAFLPAVATAAAAFAGQFVSYEQFGAIGDGVHDDLPAICEAHAYANASNLPVRSKPDATYHLGRQDLTAIIATSTDWSTSRFIIDDRNVENHKSSLFQVESLLPPVELQIERLHRDQKKVDRHFDQDLYVIVENKHIRRYIRKGLNQNSGKAQRDCFILEKDGSIASPIDWDYENISSLKAHPIDPEKLSIQGGVFTTFANNMRQETGYNYWYRNIVIKRSNTEVDGLYHYVAGETANGHPYSGFISIRSCANVTLRNCFATGHKTYKTIGSAGLPVSMGSYDYNANSVVNLSMINCRMNHILDRTRWGVIGTNFCKNILLEDCELSRMDAHMGVSGTYTIRRTTLGHMGLNAIGRGKLIIEDSTLHGSSLINFRRDYGSTWEGTVEIRNTRWKPNVDAHTDLNLFNLENDGTHDFGYTCFMPETITIDSLQIHDTGHQGELYYFANPNGTRAQAPDEQSAPAPAPFPYQLTKKLIVHNLETSSGRPPKTSPNPKLNEAITLRIE